MGTYLNCGNEAFSRITSGDYIDKTSLIGLINRTIGTTKNLICISRPRRFGKSYSAQMLSAYYDMSCDSHELFKKYEISKDSTYEKHMNKYHVINLDISGFHIDYLTSIFHIFQNCKDEIKNKIEQKIFNNKG